MATKKLTTIVIDALEDIKARDIKLINVSRITSVFDYIAVASADSTRQTKALARHVMDKVREHGGWIYGIEGEQSGEWVLVDCGDIVVHIMQPAMRELYELEELWGEGSLEFPKPKPVPKPVSKAITRTSTPVKAVPKTVAKAKTGKTVKAKASVTVKKKTTATSRSATRKTSGTVVKNAVSKTTAIVRKPATKKPAVKKPVVKKLVMPKATAKKPSVKKPASKKPVVKKPLAKKPLAKKPAAKKPAVKKSVGGRRKVTAD